ncbi:MAG: PKD domain-containing protein [Acidobacteria bacterium]|nr:PKD domain-containing protein [Acidobacteriota bacterium]
MIIAFLFLATQGAVPLQSWGAPGAPAMHKEGAPDTQIIAPNGPTKVRLGTTLEFEAVATDPEGDAVTIFWEFCGESSCILTGERISYTFDTAAIYNVICYAVDEAGAEDPSPDRVRIEVFEGNIPPVAIIHSPEQRQLSVRTGESVHFSGSVGDLDSEEVTPIWRLASDPQTTIVGNESTFRFDQRGTEVVVFSAVDSDGGRAADFRIIRVFGAQENRPPMVAIQSPTSGQVFQVREEINLQALASDPDGDPLSMRWWTTSGFVGTGPNPQNLAIGRPGRYQLQLFATDGNGGHARDSVQIVVMDPDVRPDVVIVRPRADVRVLPGQAVFFEGVVKDASFAAKYFVWVIQDMVRGTFRRIRQDTPGWVRFSEGIYQVNLFAVHPFRDDVVLASEPRRIVVKSVGRDEFLGNDRFDRAAVVAEGQYDGIALQGGRFFRLPIPSKNQDVHLTVSAAEPIGYRIQRINGQILREGVTRAGSFSTQLRRMPVGELVMGFIPLGGKRDLDFGFGVRTLNPALYLTDVRANESYGALVGIVNPLQETVFAECIGYRDDGSVLGKVPLELSPMSRFSAPVVDLFPNALNLAWVRIDATSPLQGYSLITSHDSQEAFAVSGVGKLSSEVLVPHIATKTEQWYTQAHVVNGSPDLVSAVLFAGEQTELLSNESGFSIDQFDFLDKLGGTVGTEADWGAFAESTDLIALAGSEVFGKVDGNRQIAGLSLNDGRIDNPNFFNLDKSLYFTHIARDTQQFWTGLAMVNFSSESRNLNLSAYGPGGALVGQKNLALGPKGKIVDTAEGLLADLGGPQSIDWVEIRGAEDVVGYELFGTHDNKRLAGFEAGPQLANQICFPHIQTGGDQWHGVAVVNVTDQPINVQFKLYGDAGQMFAESTRSLAAREKTVALLSDLFENPPVEAGWLLAESDGLIAGFLLFGDLAGQTMSALRAE